MQNHRSNSSHLLIAAALAFAASARPLLAHQITPVAVKSDSTSGKSDSSSGKLGGFYARKKHNKFGTFITRAQIEKKHPYNVTDLLRGTPGIIVQPSRFGGNEVRTTQRCRPIVYLDGLPYSLIDEPIDNIVSPRNLEGIEVYPNALQVPGELQRGLARCGVIALWTQR